MTKFDKIIQESLDSKVDLDRDDSILSQMIRIGLSNNGHTNVSVHTDGTDFYSTSKKDDAVEVHHFNVNSVPGDLIGDRPNPRFIANIKHLASPFLESGHKVRFVTTHQMHDSIKGLANRLNRNGEYAIHGFDTPDPETYGAWPGIELRSLEIQKAK